MVSQNNINSVQTYIQTLHTVHTYIHTESCDAEYFSFGGHDVREQGEMPAIHRDAVRRHDVPVNVCMYDEFVILLLTICMYVCMYVCTYVVCMCFFAEGMYT